MKVFHLVCTIAVALGHEHDSSSEIRNGTSLVQSCNNVFSLKQYSEAQRSDSANRHWLTSTYRRLLADVTTLRQLVDDVLLTYVCFYLPVSLIRFKTIMNQCVRTILEVSFGNVCIVDRTDYRFEFLLLLH